MAKVAPSQRKAIRWIKALRSGKYPQGKNMLKTSDGRYCCLGVANEVCFNNKAEWDGVEVLDEYFARKLGLGNEQLKWATLNDSGKSFGEIADMLEKRIIDPNPVRRFLKATFLP